MVVEILATKMLREGESSQPPRRERKRGKVHTHRVAVGRLDLKNTTVHLEDGDVEGAAAQIINGNGLAILLLVHAIGEGSSSGLIDDTENLHERCECP